MLSFSLVASSTDFSLRLGRFEFFAMRGPGRIPASGSAKYPGEVSFDVLGATAYLLNHRRMDDHAATVRRGIPLGTV